MVRAKGLVESMLLGLWTVKSTVWFLFVMVLLMNRCD